MVEPFLHRETFALGAPMTFGGITLWPVERAVTHAERVGVCRWCWFTRAPCALVIRDADGVRAVDTDAAAVPLDRLRKQVRDLDDMLGPV